MFSNLFKFTKRLQCQLEINRILIFKQSTHTVKSENIKNLTRNRLMNKINVKFREVYENNHFSHSQCVKTMDCIQIFIMLICKC